MVEAAIKQTDNGLSAKCNNLTSCLRGESTQVENEVRKGVGQG